MIIKNELLRKKNYFNNWRNKFPIKTTTVFFSFN